MVALGDLVVCRVMTSMLQHSKNAAVDRGRATTGTVASPDRRVAAEKVRHGYAAYTPPVAGQPPGQPHGTADAAPTQRQRRGGGQQAPADVQRPNGVVVDRRNPNHIVDQVCVSCGQVTTLPHECCLDYA